jgi:aminoglycoside phosphotransferase (APT) family kinase protein
VTPGAAGDVPLPSGRMTSGMVRRGDKVLRPAGPWSPAVHEYLRHLESAGFRPRRTEYRYHPFPPRAGEIVSHGDLGPWNTVYRDGIPAGFIDWDGAQPVDPLVDLAGAAWAFVPLAPPEQLSEAGFSPVPEIGARLRMFLDAYGLADRRAILPALQRSQLDLEHVAYWPLTAAEAADKLELQAKRLRWLGDVLPDLAHAL